MDRSAAGWFSFISGIAFGLWGFAVTLVNFGTGEIILFVALVLLVAAFLFKP